MLIHFILTAPKKGMGTLWQFILGTCYGTVRIIKHTVMFPLEVIQIFQIISVSFSVSQELLSCQEYHMARKINQIKMKSDFIPHNIPVKRKPVPLKIKCPVCERPAPDHLHFGGP